MTPPGEKRAPAEKPAPARSAKSSSGYLLRGDDPVLVAQQLDQLLSTLVGSEDAALVVDHLDAATLEPAAVTDACRTLPMFSTKRVVVIREAGQLGQEAVSALLEYLADPLDSTSVVVVAGGGQTSSRLLNAIRKSGTVLEAGLPSGKARQPWLVEHLSKSTLHLDQAGLRLLDEHLGNDLGRLDQILASLVAVHGEGARLASEDLAPFLGEAGDVPPWELADAIDNGDEAAALVALRRLTSAGGRHPLVILAILHRHFTAALKLEGSEATSESDAASLIGASPFAARKALSGARRLGWEGLARATCLLADADTDLRGTTAAPPEMVLDVLVARLARLSRAARRNQPKSARR